MSERYKTETIETAGVELNGWYTLADLEEIVAYIKNMNARVKKLVEQSPRENQNAKTL